jgi:hypothetical protein
MSYVYFPGKEAACGADWYWEGAFAGNSYKTIRFYVKVNTPGATALALLACNAPLRGLDLSFVGKTPEIALRFLAYFSHKYRPKCFNNQRSYGMPWPCLLLSDR